MVNELAPSTKQFSEALPNLTVSFSVLNEFFNELAYNPGPSKAGFLFFLDWGNHNLNSVLSTADAHGPIGRTLVYFNCEIIKIFKGVEEVNPTVKLLLGLLKPPTKQECINQHLLTPAGLPITASARGTSKLKSGSGLFAGLSQRPFASGTAKKKPAGTKASTATTTAGRG